MNGRFSNGNIPWNKGSGIKKYKTCEHCGNIFLIQKYRNKQRFCSNHCAKMGNAWNRGRIWGKDYGLKISKAKTGVKRPDMTNENNWNWKGDGVGYVSLHKWISRKYGEAKTCGLCGDKMAKRYEWANITGIYNRDKINWKRLCKSCHVRFDDVAGKALATKRGLIYG